MEAVITLLFVFLFIVWLYIMNTHLTKKHSVKIRKKSERIKHRQKLSVMKWRFSTLSTVFFIFLILLLNRNPVFRILRTEFTFTLLLSLLMFFISFIAIVIIDILLPEEVPIIKRAFVEFSIFIVMYIILFFVLSWF